MIRGTILVFIGLALVYGAPPDKFSHLDLPKCALKDNDCMRRLYEHIVQTIGEKGIPEVGIPPVDPIQLRDVSVSVLNLLNITMVKGVATGIRTCVFDKFSINLKKESGYQENTCSMEIAGKYKLRSDSPLINELLGKRGIIRGDGHGKVSIDKVHITYDFPIYAQIRPDGEIYMNCDYKKIIYDYEVQGGAKFWADNIYLGNQEISKEIIPLLNENWKFVMLTFGKPFIDKAMEFYFDFAGKFFNAVPARYFILDDLSPYARP